MKIALLSSEVSPYAKTGGLADVAGALPKFLVSLGLDVKVIMPFYRQTRKNSHLQRAGFDVEMEWLGKKTSFSIRETREKGVSFFFIEKDAYFDREYLYGTPLGDYPDNGERFGFFSKGALETLKRMDFRPDVIHCHDWQSAMALAYLKFLYGTTPFFRGLGSLFTIHNLAYQGIFEKEILGRLGLPDTLFNPENLEYYGKVNFLKAGILYSTAVNTVSPRYSQEIQTAEFGHGLDGLLRKRKDVLFGILNGVDYADWNPTTDRFIVKNYDALSLEGKKECRKDLLQAFSFKPLWGIPVVGMVSRLAGQKGFDLLSKALEDIFHLGLYLLILGTGEEVYQDALRTAKKKFSRNLGLSIAFDEPLSHKIMAGSDILLIPSRYEPCGLTQMYSLRYGTIPVVRATGGLDDTIQEFEPSKGSGNGFKFQKYSAAPLVASLQKAVEFYGQEDLWQTLVNNAMACDFSWDKAAKEYLLLYEKLSLS